jgi:hypothetical protein
MSELGKILFQNTIIINMVHTKSGDPRRVPTKFGEDPWNVVQTHAARTWPIYYYRFLHSFSVLKFG